MYLIWLGLRLFIIGYRITLAKKLVDWRIKHTTNYSDPLLVFLSSHYAGLNVRFVRLERKFKKMREDVKRKH